MPDRTRDLAGADLVDRGGKSLPPAVDLECPAGDLEPERGRLGVDRVRPPHHRRVGFGPSPRDEDVDETVRVVEQATPGGAELEREARIDDIAARQAEVEVSPLRPDRLRDLADERDDVVVGRALDLGDALDVDRGAGLHRRQGLRRDQATGGLGARHRELDAEDVLEASLIRPDRGHLGERVPPDHRAAPTARAPDP